MAAPDLLSANCRRRHSILRRCYEVACREARFSDGYGNAIDRSGGTCSRGGSVIVTITDAW